MPDDDDLQAALGALRVTGDDLDRLGVTADDLLNRGPSLAELLAPGLRGDDLLRLDAPDPLT